MSRFAPIAGCAFSASQLLLLAQRGYHLARVLERALDLGQTLDERRLALEEVGELLGAQLPR